MRILVTGAGGYFGARLCQRLCEDGHHVVALIHSRKNELLSKLPNLEQVNGNICDPDFMDKIMEGIDQVYHVAAFARSWAKDPREFYKVNVGGTLTVLEAAEKNKVQKVVVTSTAGTIGPVPKGKTKVTEDQVRDVRFYGDYEMSKIMADERVQHFVRKGMNVSIVCPTRIFGPGRTDTIGASLTKVLQKYAAGKWRINMGGRDMGNYVFIDDVVQGHLLVMEKGRPGEKYLIGSFNDSIRGLFKGIDEIRGHSHLTVTVPLWLLKFYAAASRGLGDLFKFDPVVTIDWVEKISRNWATDSEKAKNELGYVPTDKITALKATIEK